MWVVSLIMFYPEAVFVILVGYYSKIIYFYQFTEIKLRNTKLQSMWNFQSLFDAICSIGVKGVDLAEYFLMTLMSMIKNCFLVSLLVILNTNMPYFLYCSSMDMSEYCFTYPTSWFINKFLFISHKNYRDHLERRAVF